MVSSEVHLDGLFLDSLGEDIFREKMEEDNPDGEREERLTTIFRSSPGEKAEGALEISLEHYRTTSVALVGQQVWRGALILADYILSEEGKTDVEGKNVLELASGTGLTSVVAGHSSAANVLATDIAAVLPVLARNCRETAKVQVRELDFFDENTWQLDFEVNFILAADVCYDPQVTSAFFRVLRHFFGRNEGLTAVLAVEKRSEENFGLFTRLMNAMEGVRVEDLAISRIPRRFECYERVSTLNLWRLTKT